MINIDFPTLVILMLIAFILGMLMGISSIRPAFQNWFEPRETERNSLLKKGKIQDEDSEESSSVELSGDSTTDAPPPEKKKKGKKR